MSTDYRCGRCDERIGYEQGEWGCACWAVSPQDFTRGSWPLHLMGGHTTSCKGVLTMRWILLVLILLALCGSERSARALHEPEQMERKVREIEGRIQKLEAEIQYVRDLANAAYFQKK